MKNLRRAIYSATYTLSGNRNLNLNTGFQTDARLHKKEVVNLCQHRGECTYDLLHNLAGGVQVDQTLVDLELVAVPSLGTFTTRLKQIE